MAGLGAFFGLATVTTACLVFSGGAGFFGPDFLVLHSPILILVLMALYDSAQELRQAQVSLSALLPTEEGGPLYLQALEACCITPDCHRYWLDLIDQDRLPVVSEAMALVACGDDHLRLIVPRHGRFVASERSVCFEISDFGMQEHAGG